MVSITIKTLGALSAAYFMAQEVQCPAVAVPLIAEAAAGVAAGGISFAGAVIPAAVGRKRSLRGDVRRREFQAPDGVPQFEFDRCYNDLAEESVTVNVQGPVNDNGIQVDGLPPTCMNLATVIDGDASAGPAPIPCGSACLLYDDLGKEDYETMRTTFEEFKNA